MTKAGREPIAIAYLPWADLEEEFAVGPVSFWPFYAKAEEKIPDAQMRTDLTRFFQTFVDNVGKPVKTVVACSIGNVGFRRFSPEECQVISAAVDCLVFASIATGVKNGVCADNYSIAPPSADRFDLCARWVEPAHDGLVVRTENSTQFWSHGQYRITRPVSIGGSFTGSYGSLLQGLGRVFGDEFPADVRERLFRALEWFRFGHTESTAVSWLHKVVMMSTAFEIFLEFPERGQTAYFAEQVDKRLRLRDSLLAKRTDGKGREREACMAAWWAWDFYDLRSRVVHGDAVTAEDLQYKDWITHLIVADLVLLEMVKRLLHEHRCIGEDVRRRAVKWAENSSDSVEDVEQAMLPGILGLDLEGVHEALGWIPPLNERLRERETRLKNEIPETTD